MDITQENVLLPILAALQRAYAKHGREPWGRHEMYGILLEEVDELWDAIKADEPLERIVAEAIDIAVVLIRYMETGDRHQGPLPLPEPDYDMAEEQRKPIAERAWNIGRRNPEHAIGPWVPAADWGKVQFGVRSHIHDPNVDDVSDAQTDWPHHNALDPVAAISPEHNPNGVFLRRPDGHWHYLGQSDAVDFDAIRAPYVVALGRAIDPRSDVMPFPGGLSEGDPAKRPNPKIRDGNAD